MKFIVSVCVFLFRIAEKRIQIPQHSSRMQYFLQLRSLKNHITDI